MEISTTTELDAPQLRELGRHFLRIFSAEHGDIEVRLDQKVL